MREPRETEIEHKARRRAADCGRHSEIVGLEVAQRAARHVLASACIMSELEVGRRPRDRAGSAKDYAGQDRFRARAGGGTARVGTAVVDKADAAVVVWRIKCDC